MLTVDWLEVHGVCFEEAGGLEEAAALDLVTVLGLGKALHELAVFVGDHHGAEVGEAGVQAGLGGQTSHVTRHPLQTLLGLNDSL